MIFHNYEYLKKGAVFWYRVKKQFYGSIIIEVQKDYDLNSLYLILISEQLQRSPTNLTEILESKCFTLAWFDEYSLLSPNRIHMIGEIDIEVDYCNKFGLSIKPDGTFICNNVGQCKTWRHEFSIYAFPDKMMKSVLKTGDGSMS